MKKVMGTKYTLKLKYHFDSAHYLELDYPSSCGNLHGHRWEVVVMIEAEELDKNGMIVDFSEIKKVIKGLDHQLLNDILGFNPTAENLARYLWEEINLLLTKKSLKGRVWVAVYESPDASVTYG